MQQHFPGYQPGTYDIDPVHSSVAFSIRHMMVAKVRGEFSGVAGVIELGETPEASSVVASVDPATVDTRNADRDAHLRSRDFFLTDEHPTWEFRSTGGRVEDGETLLEGELSIRGIARPVVLRVEYGGIGQDTFGNTRAGASAVTRIRRSDFDMTWNQAIETGGVMLSDDVDVQLEISAIRRA